MKHENPYSLNPIDMSKVAFDTKYRWGNVVTPGFINRLTDPPTRNLSMAPVPAPARPNPTFTNAESYEYLPTHDMESVETVEQRRLLVDKIADAHFKRMLQDSAAGIMDTDTPCNCKTSTGKILRVVLPLLIITVAAVALGYFVAKHEGK